MKRLLLTFAAIVLASSAVPRAQAADVSFDFFYNNVSGGTWIEVADYGYCWQPDVAVGSSSRWRPYTDGYWVYSDVGWTWVSYENFGWATYHYGRWVRLSNRGWVWVVGRDSDLEWGPAWVSWRTGGDHIGWAPLPPRRRGGLALLRGAITGRVDIDFDIGPSYYNFIDVRYIGEPVLRERIYESNQNVTYINQTVNVTNITYQNNVVYNYGPDYNALSTRSSRPIQRLTLERQAIADPAAAAKSGGLMKVEGQKLIVAAPPQIKPGPKAAPPVIKEKIAKAEVDDGWSGSDPKAKEELKKKIQTEDTSKASGAASPAAGGTAAAGATASPTATVSGAATASPAATATAPATTSPSPVGKDKKGKLDEQVKPGATVAPAGSPGATVAPATTPDLGKRGKDKRGDLQTAPILPRAGTATAAPALSPSVGKEKGKPDSAATPSQLGGAPTEAPQGKAKGKGQLERRTLGPTPVQPADTSTDMPKEKGKAKQFEPSTTPPPSGGSSETPQGPGGKKSQSLDQTGGPPLGGGQPSDGGPGGKRKGPAESSVQPPSAPTGAGPTGAGPSGAGPAGGGERGKAKPADEGEKPKGKKGEEGSPSPAPY